MEKEIERITYNGVKEYVEIHYKDGSIETSPMTNEEWDKFIDTNVSKRDE